MTRSQCAICQLPRSLTKEHIWPAGFLRRSKFAVRYSARAKRTFGGDLTIKDVCGECNNGPLSRLDGYACELYDRYFAMMPEKARSVTFDYDFGRLTRWLIKIAFNSARSNSDPDVDLLKLYAPVILTEDPCLPAFVGFFVALAAPSLMMNPSTGRTKLIQPKAVRSGPIIIPGVTGYEHVSTRMVMVNGYFFTLVLSRRTTLDATQVSDLFARIPGRPLALSGRMRLEPTMDAAQVLSGIRDWPGMRT